MKPNILTPNIIQNTSTNPEIESRGRIQIVSFQSALTPVMSDGVIKTLFEVELRCRDKFMEKCKKNDVIDATFVKLKNSTFVLVDFDVQASSDKKIGNPMPLKELENNLKGQQPQKNKNIYDVENLVNVQLGKREHLNDLRDVRANPNERKKRKQPGAKGNELIGIVVIKENQKPHKGEEGAFFFRVTFRNANFEFQVMFWKQLDQRIFDLIQVGNEYSLKGCSRSLADSPYSSENSFNFNTNFSEIKLIKEGNARHDEYKYNEKTVEKEYKKGDLNNINTLDSISELPEGRYVNIMAKIVKVIEKDGLSKQNKPFKLKQICLQDETGLIELKIWNDLSEKLNVHEKEVHVFKNLRIGSFLGVRDLSFTQNSVIIQNPAETNLYLKIKDLPELNNYEKVVRKTSQSVVEKPPKFIDVDLFNQEYNNFKNGHERSLSLRLISSIVIETDKLFYRGCPNQNCKKKVKPCSDKCYYCQKCGTQSPNFQNRFMLQMKLRNQQFFISSFEESHFQEIFGLDYQETMNQIENSGVGVFLPYVAKAEICVYDIELTFRRYSESLVSITLISIKKREEGFRFQNDRNDSGQSFEFRHNRLNGTIPNQIRYENSSEGSFYGENALEEDEIEEEEEGGVEEEEIEEEEDEMDEFDDGMYE